MKVVHLTFTDRDGGAAIAVERIHQALLRAGVDSEVFVLVKSGHDSRVKAFDYHLPFTRRVLRSLRSQVYIIDYQDYSPRMLGERYELFTSDRCHLGSQVAEQISHCDLVHFHWISGFMDYRVLCRDILGAHPGVWTLHDMNPFTGGCHYCQDCDRYRVQCGCCPLLRARSDNDASRHIFIRKSKAMRSVPKGNLKIIAPSQWMARQAKMSPIFSGKDVQVIPHPIDTQTFFPFAISAPDLAALSTNGKIIVLFIAHSALLPRKGYRYLIQALEHASLGDKAILLTVGGGRPPSPACVEHVHLDSIEDAGLLNQVYNLADVCVVPSIHEAFGMTAQEALASGTPVIGFDTGGCADMIRHGRNGLLVSPGDVKGLSEAISLVIHDDKARRAMSENARADMLAQGAEDIVASSYLRVYKGLLNGGTSTE